MLRCEAYACKYNFYGSCGISSEVIINNDTECFMFCYSDYVDLNLKNKDGLRMCPHCHSFPILKKYRNKFFYECDGDCWASTDRFDTIEEAKNAWNSFAEKGE